MTFLYSSISICAISSIKNDPTLEIDGIESVQTSDNSRFYTSLK